MIRLRSAYRPVIVGALVVMLLPMQHATVSGVAGAQATNAHEGKPDPCTQLADVPGNAKGLHKQCAEFGGGSGVARGDFNGDGIGDLAIGVPYENVGSATNAGAVNIIYGSVSGLTSTGNQFFTQNSTGVPGVAETDDHFGLSLAAVDFDDDGISDLAVAAPTEDTSEGLVQLLMGSMDGLVPGQALTFNSLQSSTCGCLFGSALAWGDFDDDGRPDLAIGMRAYEVDHVDAGGVLIRFGNGARQIVGFSLGFPHPTPSDSNASFGMRLAAGDHNGDGYDDLAIGAPLQHAYDTLVGPLRRIDYAGLVHLYEGRSTGLNPEPAAVLSQSDAGGTVETGDQFGRSLTFGDFDHDGRDDLVVGAPFEHFGGSDVGAVSIFYGDGASRTITQDDLSGVEAEASDMFGFALAAGDFDLDGSADLAIGVPGEDIGSPLNFLTFFQNAGVVHVLYGSSLVGLQVTSSRNQVWHQDKPSVPGAVELGDEFGYSLSAWNFGNGSFRDLAISVPFEDVSDKTDAGAVVVLYGQGAGLSATNAQIWHQDSPGILDTASGGDRFGNSMY